MEKLKEATIFLIIAVYLAISVYAVYNIYPLPASFEKDLLIALTGGTFGGVFYMSRGFYQSVVQGIFDFNKYIWWYLLRPPMAALAGATSYLLIYSAFDLEPTFKNTCVFLLASLFAGYNFTAFVDGKIKNGSV